MNNIADDTRWMDATEQAELVAGGAVSPGDLVDAAIARIETLDGPVNSVAVRWFDEARAQAAAPIPPEAPFPGVPTLLKDLNLHEAGRVITNGNVALRREQTVSAFDSELTVRLRRAGLVTLGRSTSCELGTLPVAESRAYGPTRNPWDLTVTPGGSSGGAAAAVAAGMVPVAHASDGGGSIRIPASCCGLVGLKPSQGRISQGPDRQESGLAVDFFITRSVRDAATLLDAVAGPGIGDDAFAPTPRQPFAEAVGTDPGRLRIGVLDHVPGRGPVHPDCAAAVNDAAAQLEAIGHEVEAAWPASLELASLDEVFFVFWATSRAMGILKLAAMAGRELAADEVEAHNAALAEFANGLSAVDHAKAVAAAAAFRRSTAAWWAEGFDLLLTPTLATPPIPIGTLDPPADNPLQSLVEASRFVGFTGQFNLTGQPAISLPTSWNADNLPIGTQLVAAYGREDLLLQVAAQLETTVPWSHRRPPQDG